MQSAIPSTHLTVDQALDFLLSEVCFVAQRLGNSKRVYGNADNYLQATLESVESNSACRSLLVLTHFVGGRAANTFHVYLTDPRFHPPREDWTIPTFEGVCGYYWSRQPQSCFYVCTPRADLIGSEVDEIISFLHIPCTRRGIYAIANH